MSNEEIIALKLKYMLFYETFIKFALCIYRTLLCQPNFIQTLSIWPDYHSFPRNKDPKDNKKLCLVFS